MVETSPGSIGRATPPGRFLLGAGGIRQAFIRDDPIQRGDLYNKMMEGLLNTMDSNGTYHIVGFEWWDLYDMRREQTNWGLLTPRDNAYDGVQAVEEEGTDAWGYSTGGEHTGSETSCLR